MSKINKTKKKSAAPEKGPLLLKSSGILTEKDLTPGQAEADRLIGEWLRSKKKIKRPVFRIGALAGAGKSAMIAYLINKYGFDRSNCYVMAYTGQAVNRLRSDGILATTIHSAIMVPHEEVILDKKTGKPIMKRGVPLVKVTFKPVKKLPSSIELLIIDEASFVSVELENILLRYNCPILELGDYFQLPPVGGRQAFTAGNIDYFMEGVMRQSADSEILEVASKIRYGLNIDPSLYHDQVLFARQEPTVEETFIKFRPFFATADVIITSTNKQRQIISDMYREKILKTDSPYPIEGERMICRKNNWTMTLDQYALTNGTRGICRESVGMSLVDKGAGIFYMDFEPDVVADSGMYFDNLPCDIEYLHKPFGSSEMIGYAHPGEKMEFAHALTVYAMQGSQEDTVIFMDSFSSDSEYLARLRYTAVTRAKKRVIYMIPHTRYPKFFDMRNIEERRARAEAESDE